MKWLKDLGWLLVICLCFCMNIHTAVEAASSQEPLMDVYDVILFWGQSNMEGFINYYPKHSDYTSLERLQFLDETATISDLSKITHIDKDILEKEVALDYVAVKPEAGSAFEYIYHTNSLEEITENNSTLGENLSYKTGNLVHNSYIKLPNGQYKHSISQSYGTNMIPQFCKTYVEKTRHKVIVVFAANPGEKIEQFLPNNDSIKPLYIYETILLKYQAAIDYLEQHNLKIGKRIWVSYQGESNNASTEGYLSSLQNVTNNLSHDLGITNGVIVETGSSLKTSYWQGIEQLNQSRNTLVKNSNGSVIIGSTYPVDTTIPSESIYNSSSYKTNYYQESTGEKMEHQKALNYANLTRCLCSGEDVINLKLVPKSGNINNTVHLTSAALSQVGKDCAEKAAKAFDESYFKVGNSTFSTLQSAYESISGTTGTITVLQSGIVDNSKLIIENNKEITIDTNGKSLTIENGIENNGTLIIKGKGTITTPSVDQNKVTYVVSNTGSLTIDGASLINKGNRKATWGVIYTTDGSVIVKSGNLSCQTTDSLALEQYPLTICVRKKSTITISGGTIETVGAKGVCINTVSNTSLGDLIASIKMTGGTLKSPKGIAISNVNSGGNHRVDISIKDGTIEANLVGMSFAANTTGSVIITGGTIKSGQNYALLNRGNLNVTVGTKDNNFSTTSPKILGQKGAIDSTTAFSFYDGLLGGVEKAYSSEIKEVENNCEIESGSEKISGVTYNTAKLKNKTSNGQTEIETPKITFTPTPIPTSTLTLTPTQTVTLTSTQTPTKTPSTSLPDIQSDTSFEEDDITKENTVEFANVSDWAVEEMKEAKEKKLIPETFINLDFTQTISRAEFCAVSVKMYEAVSGKKAKTAKNFPFVDIEDEYVSKAYNVGITNGTTETTFSPDMMLSREQMATMLTRALTKAGIKTSVNLDIVAKFSDDTLMSPWGKEAVYFMSGKGIIKGMGENTFGVNLDATREQALAISLRSVKMYE